MIRPLVIAALLGTIPLQAATLPELSEKEWMGSWIGCRENEFDYSDTAKDGKAAAKGSELVIGF
jgi:hypothetical protein